MFIGQVDNISYDYARIRIKPFRRKGGALVRGFTRKLKKAGIHKEAIVGGSGLIGAKAGFLVGGPPGSLVGEFVLSNTSRRAIDDFGALKQSIKNLKSNRNLGDLSKLQKLKLIHQESAKVLRERIEQRRDDFAGDVGGFIGGTLLGNQIGIPFAGLALGPAGAKATQTIQTRFRRRKIK